jgi:hypothetical protein
MNLCTRVWSWRPIAWTRRALHRWPALVAFLLFGVAVTFAFVLDAQQGREIEAEFRRDAALNDYSGCLSGNRLRDGIREQNEGVLAVLGPAGREAFLPIYRGALQDFQPRECGPLKETALEVGVTDAQIRKAEQVPPALATLPLASCEGIGPFVEGVDEAYFAELDRDDDGVACE